MSRWPALLLVLPMLLPLLAGCVAPAREVQPGDSPVGPPGPDPRDVSGPMDYTVPPPRTGGTGLREPWNGTGNHSVPDREEPDVVWEYEGETSPPPEQGPPAVESRVEHGAGSLVFSWRLGPEATLRGVERGDCDCPAEARFLEGWWSVRVDDLRNVAQASLRVHVEEPGGNWTVVLTADVPLRVLRFEASPEEGCLRVVATAAGVEEPRWVVEAEPVDTGESWSDAVSWSFEGDSFCWSPVLRPLVADALYRLRLRLHDGEESVRSDAVDVRSLPYGGAPVTDVTVEVEGRNATLSWLLDGEPLGGELWLHRDGNLSRMNRVPTPGDEARSGHRLTLEPGTHSFVVAWRDGTLRATDLRTFVVPA